MTTDLWALWGLTTVAFMAANTINSRARNSASRVYNTCATFITSVLYAGSLVGLGDAVVTNNHHLILLGFGYAALSTVGSVIGQEVALRYFQKVEQPTKARQSLWQD